MKTMTFTIPEEDIPAILKFQKEVEQRRLDQGHSNYAGCSGGATTYIFTPTSLGLAIEVSHFGEKLDLSHCEDW